MKTKVGTLLENKILKKLKEYSVRENLPINEVIEKALTNYFRGESKPIELRLQSVEKLCSRPFNLTFDEMNGIIEEDYYGQ